MYLYEKGKEMIEVKVRDNTTEEFDKAVKFFKKRVNDEGHLRELQERKYYSKPSERRRKKEIMRQREMGKGRQS